MDCLADLYLRIALLVSIIGGFSAIALAILVVYRDS